MAADVNFTKGLELVFQTYSSFEPEPKRILQITLDKLNMADIPIVIQSVIRRFGVTAAISAFEMFDMSSKINERWKPKIEVLKLFVDTKNVDTKTALYVLNHLGIYNQSKYNWKDINTPMETLVEPIKLIGNRYGQQAALEALEIARDHCCIGEMKPLVTAYFETQFNMKPTEEQFSMTWSRRLTDAILGEQLSFQDELNAARMNRSNYHPFDPRT